MKDTVDIGVSFDSAVSPPNTLSYQESSGVPQSDQSRLCSQSKTQCRSLPIGNLVLYRKLCRPDLL